MRRDKIRVQTPPSLDANRPQEPPTEDLPSNREDRSDQAQMRAISTLAMSIAYDLRNILTTLRMEMAEAETVSEQASIYKQLDRLYALTYSLLALSDEPYVHSSPVDLSEIIDFVFKLIHGQAEVDGATLIKRIQLNAPFAFGNPRRLEHLFVVLLLNALHAVAPTGGTITVVIRDDVGRVRVDVSDTGPGIPPEHLPHLFEPFFTTRANRAGLGLFSARRIVEAHQGEITVLSGPEPGACVSVWLPAAATALAPL